LKEFAVSEWFSPNKSILIFNDFSKFSKAYPYLPKSKYKSPILVIDEAVFGCFSPWTFKFTAEVF
jgi:hypothetical protein